jgi:hypothetical protein
MLIPNRHYNQRPAPSRQRYQRAPSAVARRLDTVTEASESRVGARGWLVRSGDRAQQFHALVLMSVFRRRRWMQLGAWRNLVQLYIYPPMTLNLATDWQIGGSSKCRTGCAAGAGVKKAQQSESALAKACLLLDRSRHSLRAAECPPSPK